MAIDPKGFPLDLTGSNVRNKVVNDARTLTTNADAIFVPDGGPFFTRSMVIRSGTTILKPNVDYKCLHLLKDASLATGLDVCGVVMITNEQVTQITMTYQVIGGEYANTVPIIRQLLENADNLEPSINWNTNVYGKPEVYPAAPHYVSGDEFSDWSTVVMGLQSIERAILLKDVAAWESMYQYMDNLIGLRLNSLDLSQFVKIAAMNVEIGKLATKTTVYTKVESDAKYYNKVEIDAKLGDIDGNETYYTEREINAKFIEALVADSKYATKAELNRVDSLKADASSVYTRAQTDDKYIEKVKTYNRDYIDANLALKTASYTKPESDARYAYKADSYNKVDSDQRYALKGQIPSAPDLSKFITRDEVDNAYLKLTTADATYLRKSTADSIYAKIGDLDKITQVDAKFANYYTKTQADAKYYDKTSVNATFLTKTDASNLYLTKQTAGTTYSTKAELKAASNNLVNLIAGKSDITFVNNTFATKSDVADNYYTRGVSDDRYYTKAGANAYFVDLAKFNATVSTLSLKTELTSAINTVNAKFNNYPLTTWVNTNFYTKTDSDSKYTTRATYNSNKTTTDGLIAARATIDYVDKTFAKQTFVIGQYYNKVDSDARYVQQTYLTTNYKNNTQLTSMLATYATSTQLQNSVNTINNQLSNIYRKADVYSKAESNNLYLTKQPDSFTTYGSGDITLVKSSASSQTSPTINFKRESQFLLSAQAAFDTSVSRWSLVLKAGQGKVVTDTTTGVGNVLVVSPVHVWTQAYGNLNDYFTPRTMVYTKELVYTKSEVQTSFLTITTAASTYLPKTTYTTGFNELTTKIGTKTDTTWVTANYYNRTSIDGSFYTKDYINTNFHTKTAAATAFASKGELSAAVDKRVTWAEYNLNKTQVSQSIANVYNKTQSDARYLLKADIDNRAKTDWVTTNYYNKTDADGRYYTKTQADAKFLTITNWKLEYSRIDARLKVVEARSEVYKVGDLFITTTNFASSAAVAQSIGYGTWARYSQGRTLVGISPNGYVDGDSNTGGDVTNSLRKYNPSTMNMGTLYGEHHHFIAQEEMPWHKHSANEIFNKFSARALDVLKREQDAGRLQPGYGISSVNNYNTINTKETNTAAWVYYNGSGGGGITTEGADNENPSDELMINGFTTGGWAAATEEYRGGNAPLAMSQPSVVVGIWKRVG